MSVVFGHPYASPTLSITLKNPSLGDAEQHDIKTKFHISMDNTFYSTKATPATKTLTLTFPFLDKTKYEELITFLETSNGSEIKYTDQNSQVWRGYMLADPAEFDVYAKLGSTCVEAARLTLQFTGSIV